MSAESTASKGFEWKWLIVGVVAGTALCVSLFQIMAATFHTGTVPTFMSLLGFVVMGIIIGYKSEGYTIKEPAIGGAITVLLAGGILKYGLRIEFSTIEFVVAPIVGLILGFIGGWVGEQIQVTPEEAAKELEEAKKGKLQWGWIAAGTILAFVANSFFVFGGFALLKFGVNGILVSLGASFLLAGLLTGYFSPGITIKEAGIAGLFSVILNFLMLFVAFDGTILPISYMAEVVIGGLVLSLVGGWLGEKLQSFMEDRIEE